MPQDQQGSQRSEGTTQATVIGFALVLIVVVAVASWKMSAYVGSNQRTQEENVALRAEVESLTKEITKLQERLQSSQPGWRPGAPIGGVPAGSVPTGSSPSGKPPVGSTP